MSAPARIFLLLDKDNKVVDASEEPIDPETDALYIHSNIVKRLVESFEAYLEFEKQKKLMPAQEKNNRIVH